MRLLISILLLLVCSTSYSAGPLFESPEVKERVHFYLLNGRLQLNPFLYKAGSTDETRGDKREKIDVVAMRGTPYAHLLSFTKDRTVILSIENTNEVKIKSIIGEEECVLVQKPFKKISLTFKNEKGEETKYSGNTLLHIRSENKELFDKHFEELFTIIFRDSSFASLHEAAHKLAKKNKSTYNKEKVDELLQQLGSRKSSSRQTARKELVGMGNEIYFRLLDELENKQVDIYRSAVIRQIINTTKLHYVMDNAALLSRIIKNDSSYWEINK